jgi:hypothetical protein
MVQDSNNFLDGQVVQMFSALTKACSPTLKLGAGVHQQSNRILIAFLHSRELTVEFHVEFVEIDNNS